jgi:hypothetical protein
VLGVPLLVTARQLRPDRRAAAAAGLHAAESEAAASPAAANASMRRGVDPQAQGARRHHGVRHEHRRQAWWIPNGGFIPVTSNDPLFAGVTLPPRAAGGQAQVITTKTLLIYGTGRSGGVPGAAAAVRGGQGHGQAGGRGRDPRQDHGVPMTFLHKGKQYIVFATGAGRARLAGGARAARDAANRHRGGGAESAAVHGSAPGALRQRSAREATH